MKTILRGACAASLLCALLAMPVQADDFIFTAGSSGDFTAAVAFTGERWGIFGGAKGNGEISSGDVQDYPVPHSDYRVLGEMILDNSYSLGGIYKVDLAPKQALRIHVGFSAEEEAVIAQSNVTGWYYVQKKSTNIAPTAGVFYSYLAGEKFGVVVGGDTYLGAHVGLLYQF